MPFKTIVRKLIDTAELPVGVVIFRTDMFGLLLENVDEETKQSLNKEVPLIIDFITDWGDLVVMDSRGVVTSLWWEDGAMGEFKELVERAKITDVFDTNTVVTINDGGESTVVNYEQGENDFESGIKAKGIASLLFTPFMYDLDKEAIKILFGKAMDGGSECNSALQWRLAVNFWLQDKSVDNAFRLGGLTSIRTQANRWQDVLSTLTMANLEPALLREIAGLQRKDS